MSNVIANVQNCRLCRIPGSRDSAPLHDRPIVETDAYFAVATIGAIVRGWSLICPKEHKVNLAHHYGRSEFRKFMRSVADRVIRKFGSVVLFEHGASCENSATSCGTTHAHLHVVPLLQSLRPLLAKSRLRWDQTSLSRLQSGKGREYLLYFEDFASRDPQALIHWLDAPRSQFFRRLVAASVSRESEFDYRVYPFISEAEATYLSLASPRTSLFVAV